MTINRFIKPLLLLAGLLTVLTSHSQEYNYIHYDVKDGLAGSTVYDVCQDIDGFIWFATESGLSRFDGTHFKNFTTADGLPETEILRLFADSKGRVWMTPFKNAICYYYKGKIYNQDNDSTLKKIKLISLLGTMYGSFDGKEMLLLSEKDAYTIHNDTIVTSYHDLIQGQSFKWLFRNSKGNGFIIGFKNDSNYLLNGGKATYLTESQFIEDRKVNSQLLYARVRLKITSEDFIPGTSLLLFTSTPNGTWMVDTATGNRYGELFLKGKQTSHVLIDKEKNIWFSTLGEGVYKLASREFKTYYFKKNQTAEIFSITKINNTIYAGTAFGRVYSLNGNKLDTISIQKEFDQSSVNINSTNRVITLRKAKDGLLIVGADGLMVKKTPAGAIINPGIFSIKSMDEGSDGSLLVGTGRRVLVVDPITLKATDTVWHYRSTSVCVYKDAYYIGTINGLYIITKDKQARYMGDVYAPLKQRISSFCQSPDGRLWIATFGAGIICMKDGKVIGQTTVREGISSNICRTMFLNGDFLWVGTDKGLNKINTSQTPYPVIVYSTSDGLPSDLINAVYADGNNVYVGTPAGLTFFDETKITNDSKCNLRILNVTAGNKTQPLQDNYRLGYRDNNLKIAYAGISLKSGGNVWYRYRLKGLSDNWDSTSQNTLEYGSLSAGNYEFEMMAINRKGIVSNPIKIAFLVEAAFWQTLPFQVLVIAVAILVTWILVAWRFGILRKAEQQKVALQQRLNDLEQMALRAQMNPHFIFNCLNSIQNFIINNDLEATNWYLTGFAHLIRQTLDNSEKSNITIANEISYLKRYLELEMMRFGNSFNFTIEVDPTIDPDEVTIPTMILQPYIENSIRHGIRYKQNGEGRIDVKFLKINSDFVCIIQDNGIGRKKANDYKSRIHVEYQSKGMSLTAERINILNREQSNPISIEIIDLMDADEQPAGTKIVIRFPDPLH